MTATTTCATPLRPDRLIVGLAALAVFVLLALFGPAIAPRDPQLVDLDARLLAPLTPGHPLGTDQLGRDLLSRLLEGLRWSLAVSASATALAVTIGTTLGLIGARSRGLVASAVRQITALAQSFPVFVLAVSIIAITGNGFTSVVLTLGLVTWPVFSRVVLAEASSILQREYVLAASMMQMSEIRLMLQHVLPGLVPSLSVLFAFHFADMLIAESALSFLGIGAPLGASTWGAILNDSRAYLLTGPWLLLVPAMLVVSLVITFNLIGDGIRQRVAAG
jgi:peptide/nickel transport system permease protein